MNRSARIGCGLSAGLLLALAGLMAFGVYRLQNDRRATLVFKKAESALDQPDFDEAIVLFDQALQLHLPPAKAAEAYYGRGLANTHKSKYDEAIRDFSEALRLDSRKVDAFWGRGHAYQRKDELEKALADYGEFLQRNPNAGLAYSNRGMIYMKHKEWAKAALDFSEAIRCLPGDASAYLNRGAALLELGDLDGALASLDASISINPLPEAYKTRAVVHKRRGNEEQARNDWMESTSAKVAPDPFAPVFGSPGADLLRRAHTAVAAGRYDEAIDLCNQAMGLTLNPSLASAVFMTCGDAYAGKKDWDHALLDYDETIKIDPKNADAWVNRGNTYGHKEQHDRSIQNYDEAIRLNPNLEEAYSNRALQYLALKNVDKALPDLTEAIRLNPKSAWAYRWRILALLELKRTDEALVDAETLVTLRPELSDAYYCRAEAHLARRDYPKARVDFERAIELGQQPQGPPLNSAAWFYATCPEKAMRDGKRAVELATKACQLTKWENARDIDTLAAAFAESGNFNEAIKWQTYAFDLSTDPVEIRSGMEKRRQLYQKHQAYRAELKS